PVYAPADADIRRVECVRVTAGEEFTAAGFGVKAVGGRHASVYDGKPDCVNLGYIVDGGLYHPGDSLHLPDLPVETVLVPVHGSWMKTDEAIDFVNAVAPVRAFGIHDAQLNERGLEGTRSWLTRETGGRFCYLAPGDSP
ncbi:MAG TPA: MBL fold metallo-hydrolase, partial [Actinomycetes bacterium]|nr:MBL fold metallo-hydrolase [Actinomycetes bacterium]